MSRWQLDHSAAKLRSQHKSNMLPSFAVSIFCTWIAHLVDSVKIEAEGLSRGATPGRQLHYSSIGNVHAYCIPLRLLKVKQRPDLHSTHDMSVMSA